MSVAFNHEGTKIVSGSVDKTIRIWNVNGELLKTLEVHTDSINSVAFDHDGMRIVSGSDDKTIRIWDVLNGDLLKTLQIPRDSNEYYRSILSVAYNHDGTKIVSGSYGGKIALYTRGCDRKGRIRCHVQLATISKNSLPNTNLVMRINDEDCDIGDADTKKNKKKINVLENGVEWDKQGTSTDAKLYVFCGGSKNWLNTHTGSNTFGEDSVYLENVDLHDTNPFNNKEFMESNI